MNLYGKVTDPHGPTPRIGWEKRKWGGMQVGVPWEPRILGLIRFGRLYIGIGEAYIPIHVIYEAEINILGP